MTTNNDICGKVLLNHRIDWINEIADIQAKKNFERMVIVTKFYLYSEEIKGENKQTYNFWSSINYDNVHLRYIRKFAKYICTSKLVCFVNNDFDDIFKELLTRKIDWSDALWAKKNYNFELLLKIAQKCPDNIQFSSFWKQVEYFNVSNQFLLDNPFYVDWDKALIYPRPVGLLKKLHAIFHPNHWALISEFSNLSISFLKTFASKIGQLF